MKDIVESALKHTKAEQREAAEDDTNEFGPPRFVLIGGGERGQIRAKAGIANRTYREPPPSPLEGLVITVCVGDSYDPNSGLDSEQIQINDPTRLDSDLDGTPSDIEDLLAWTDFCFLTVSLAERDVVTATAEIAERAEETTTVVFASITDGTTDGIDQLMTTTNTVVLFDEDVIERSPMGEPEVPPNVLTDRLIRELATDIVEIPTVPGPIGVDYAQFYDIWNNGGLAVPAIARLTHDELTVEEIADSLIPFAHIDGDADRWFGYAVGGSEFRLSEFEDIQQNLPSALANELQSKDGVLGGRIQESLGDTVELTALRAVENVASVEKQHQNKDGE